MDDIIRTEDSPREFADTDIRPLLQTNANPDKSENAFAYFTEVAKRGFAKGWNKLHPKKYAGTISMDGGYDNEGIYTI